MFVTDATVQLSETIGVPSATPTAVHPKFGLTLTLIGATMIGSTSSPIVTVIGNEVTAQPFEPTTVTV